MDPPSPMIAISPIGDFPSGFFIPLQAAIKRVFGYPSRLVPLVRDLAFAYDPHRNQYHSTRILSELSARAPVQFLKVVAVTRVDLFIPVLTYVYGEAQLGGTSCIVSVHRLEDRLPPLLSGETLQLRLTKEATHELGHTFNLRHCKERSCLMHYGRDVQDVDRKSDRLCRYCQVLLSDEIRRLETADSTGSKTSPPIGPRK